MKLVQLVLVVGAVAALSACGAAETVSTGERPVTAPAEPGSERATTTAAESGSEPPPTAGEPIESASPLASPARFFDDEIVEGAMYVDWFPYDGVNGLVEASDLVFVGTIVGSTQAELLDGPDPDDPSGSVIEYDGIVFRIDELLAGTAPDDSGRATVAHPAVIRGSVPDVMRVEVFPIGVVREGLAAIDDGRSPSSPYLVFAVYSGLSRQVLVLNTHDALTELTGSGQSESFLREVRNCASGNCPVFPESACDTDPTLTCELPDGAVFDDRWVATVTLECGSQPSKRRIVAFDAETAGYGDPVLSTGARQSNGGILTTGTRIVGDEVDADGLLMFWNIQNVLLGPWDLEDITDTCNDPNADPITEATTAPPPETTEQP